VITPPEIEAYVEAQTTPAPPHLAALHAETLATQTATSMLSGVVEGRFLELLVWISRAKLVLEIGTYTGSAAQFMAGALPEGGRVVTCEFDPERAAFAREHMDAGPHGDRIEILTGPALDSIAALDGPFDLVFIDADKASYVDYYEAVLPKLSERGVIAADNTLWSGRVAGLDADVFDEGGADESTLAIARFNDHVAADPRTVQVMLSVRDGVTLIRHA
jgi:Predicted O-methyltransferase